MQSIRPPFQKSAKHFVKKTSQPVSNTTKSLVSICWLKVIPASFKALPPLVFQHFVSYSPQKTLSKPPTNPFYPSLLNILLATFYKGNNGIVYDKASVFQTPISVSALKGASRGLGKV